MDIFSGEVTLVKIVIPSEKGSTLKRVEGDWCVEK